MSAPAPASSSSQPVDGSVNLHLQRVLSAWLRQSWPLMWKRSPAITDGAAGATSLLVSSPSKQLNTRIAAVQKSFDEVVQAAAADGKTAALLQQPVVLPIQRILAAHADAPAPLVTTATLAAAAPSTRSTRSKRGSADLSATASPSPSASSSAATAPSPSSSSNLLLSPFPVLLSSLCVEFELTRYSRLGTRVIYRAPSAAPHLQVGVCTPLPHSDQDIQRAAANSHGFVTLESVWPGVAASDDGTFTATLSELLNAMRTFYEAPFSELEWRFLRRAVEASTLSATDPGVQELLLPAPVVSAVPNWPEPHFNWPEKWITRSLELMELDTSGSLTEKGMRIFTHESVGEEKYGSDQSFGLGVRIKVVLESRAAKEDLPINLTLTSDWSEEDASLLARELWAAHPLQDDPDRPALLQRPGGLRFTLGCVPQGFAGMIALPVIWSYREFLNTLRGGGSAAAAAAAPRRPDVVAKIEAVLQKVHQQRLDRIQSPGVQAMAQAGKRGGKARKGEPAAAAASDSSAASASASASSAEREPCLRNQLLGGRERIALMDVTTAEVARLAAAQGHARTPVDIKIDIELE